MEEIKLSNGKILKKNHADFLHAIKLKNAVFKELSNSNISFKSLGLDGLKKIKSIEAISKIQLRGGVLELLMKGLLNIDSSEQIEEAFFLCVSQCTYDGEKITTDTFNDISARGQYMKIKYEVIKMNMLPFFQDLVSHFLENQNSQQETDTQK